MNRRAILQKCLALGSLTILPPSSVGVEALSVAVERIWGEASLALMC